MPPVPVGDTVVCTVLVGVDPDIMGPPGLLDVIDEFALGAVDDPTPAGPVGVRTETDEEFVVEVVFAVTP